MLLKRKIACIGFFILLFLGLQGCIRSLRSEQFSSVDVNFGLAELAKGHFAEADKYLNDALSRNPNDAHALMAKGLLNQKLGNRELARNYYEQVLALSPPDSERMVADFNSNKAVPLVDLADARLTMLATEGITDGVVGEVGSKRGEEQKIALNDDVVELMENYSVSRGTANIISRFKTLEELLEDGFITSEEYDIRRKENIGALLPYSSSKLPAVSLARNVPSAAAIKDRLNAMSVAVEKGTLGTEDFVAERSAILDGLLPRKPFNRATRPSSVKSVFGAANLLKRLEAIRALELISENEYEKERAAIENSSGYAVKRSGTSSSSSSANSTTYSSGSGKLSGVHYAAYIASYKTKRSASNGWSRIHKSFSSKLSGKYGLVNSVDIPERGTFYRLSIGPFNNASEANSFCDLLKENQLFCKAGILDLSKVSILK